MSKLNLDLDKCRELVTDKLVENVISSEERNRHGWGQFLTLSKMRIQVGFLGTASGVAGITGSTRSERIPKSIIKTFNKYWLESDNEKNNASRRFAQNSKLSIYAITVGLIGNLANENKADKLTIDIGNRQIQGFGWGDWFISNDDYDLSIRPIPTAMMVLALKFLGQSHSAVSVSKAENYLFEFAKDNDNSPEVRSLALFAATLQPSTISKGMSLKVYRDIRLPDRGMFFEYANFYELKYKVQDRAVWASEVMTFPPNLIYQCLSVIHSESMTGAYHTLFGSEVMRKSLVQTKGEIVPVSSSRTHLLLYFWLGVYFSLIDDIEKKPSKLFAILHSIYSPMSNNVFLYRFLPTIILIAIATLTILVSEMGLMPKVLVAFLTLTIGAALGPNLLKRWLPKIDERP